MISSRILSDSNLHETHEDTHSTDFADGEFHHYSVSGRVRVTSAALPVRNNLKSDINAFEEVSGGIPSQLLSLKNIVREYKSLFKNWRKEMLSNPAKTRFANFMKLLSIHFKE